jgi:hypothetical protein
LIPDSLVSQLIPTQVRSQIVTNAFFIPLANQTPVENDRLIINSQIPPLTPPVTNSTPPNPLHAQTSFENITHIQHDLYRAAWKQIGVPQSGLNAGRWSALSVVQAEDGTENRTLYESREVFDGPLAYVIQGLFGAGLQEGFDAQGAAMKALLEG